MKATTKKPEWKLEDGHRVDKAFMSGGTQYYYVKDTFDTFAHRGLCALDVYEQWKMRCTPEFLSLHVQAMNKIFNTSPIELTEIVKLNNALRERLQWAIPTEDIIWQFAAVVFFDHSESPYKYEAEYAKQKIAHWRAAGDVQDFFYSMPLKELIPLPDLSQIDLQAYMKVINRISQKHSGDLRSILSLSQQSSGLSSELSYQESLQRT